MEKVRSSAVAVLVAAVLVLAGACSSSGSDKAKTDTGSANTEVASDTGSGDTGTTSDTGDSADTGESTTGGGTEAPGHGEDADGLKSAAEDFSKKLISDDPAPAYAYLTAECKGKVTQAEFEDEIKQSLALLEQFATNGTELSIGEVQTQDVADGKGQVAVELLGDDGKPLTTGDTEDTEPSFEDWIYEDGEWRPVSCGSSGEMGEDSASFDTIGSGDFT